jgi:polyphosphate kinase
LEHSRIFYFEINDVRRMWLSSADWMSRNMIRRIEIAWPINDAAMQTRIMQECVMPYLTDSKDAWQQGVAGEYTPINHAHGVSAQVVLVNAYEIENEKNDARKTS